ncbi:MAG: serine/threonine protein kinase, partial [bacterium]
MKEYNLMSNLLANRYKLIKSLGKGGMGEVFLAHDTILDRKVAIKSLSQDLTQKKEFLQRFLREAKITASLDHFNIVKVYDLLIFNNQYFLVMEYIEGYSLREFIEKGKNKDLNLSLEIFLQILDGVEYAHGKGVVHRDLKPENIMLTKDNVVKITDFGIAFALGSHSITNPGVLMGTLAYLSPEQAQGINVDQQTDIYSLGVILYELLTSNLPIVAVNPASMIYKILNENPLPPTKYNPSIPPQIEKIILKCLQKDKNLRYQNISQIKKDFKDYFSALESELTISSVEETSQKVNMKENIVKESINELVQKTIGDILSEISSYKKNIQDIFYKNP